MRSPRRLLSLQHARPCLAWVAAYLLVMQMLAVGLGLGMQAALAAAPDTPFGDSLCLGAGDHRPDPDRPLAAHPDCCLRGCLMLGAPAGPPPAAFVLIAPEGTASARLLPPRAPQVPGLRPHHRFARGPPAISVRAAPNAGAPARSMA